MIKGKHSDKDNLIKTAVMLPHSVYRNEIPKNATIVSVTEDLEIRFDGELINMLDIQIMAGREVWKNQYQEFVLKIDKTVKYKYVDEILEQLRQAKVLNLSLPTEREAVQ